MDIKRCPFCGGIPALYGTGGQTMYDELIYKLEELVCDRIKDTDDAMLVCDAINAINALNKPRWIPVTERLPEEKTYVLILFDTIAGKMSGVCFLYRDDDGHNCWTWLDRIGKNLFDIQPTHWMPLPQPPKEE